MAEPFPALPSWVVWLIIAFVILTGVICMATVIAGVYTEKWWLISLGVAFCAVYYFKVLRLIFQ
jgi:hypothetical protein